MVKRNILLEGLFRDICTQEEAQKADSLFLAGRKGSYVAFMLRKIQHVWPKMVQAYFKGNGHQKRETADIIFEAAGGYRRLSL